MDGYSMYGIAALLGVIACYLHQIHKVLEIRREQANRISAQLCDVNDRLQTLIKKS